MLLSLNFFFNALLFGSSIPVHASQKYNMRKMFLSKYSSLGVNNKPKWSITCCDYGQNGVANDNFNATKPPIITATSSLWGEMAYVQ